MSFSQIIIKKSNEVIQILQFLKATNNEALNFIKKFFIRLYLMQIEFYVLKEKTSKKFNDYCYNELITLKTKKERN